MDRISKALKTNFNTNYLNIDGMASILFNLIRALAAFFVLFGHLRGSLFVTYNDAINQGLLLKTFYFLTSLGHEAVMIFFVLSGFFISGSVLNNQFENKWSWKKYLINRLTRIYIVLIPALFVTVILDKVGIRLFGFNDVYTDAYAIHNNPIIVFLGNAFYLQGILVPTLGTNGPLWSLNYEFWYYILFPVLIISFKNSTTMVRRFAHLIIALLLLIFIGDKISSYFVIWLSGAIILLIPAIHVKDLFKKILIGLIASVFFLVAVYYSRLGSVGVNAQNFLADFFVSIMFALLMYLILHLFSEHKKEGKILSNLRRISKFFADFSFTLYLIHYPIMIFLMAWYESIGGEKLQPTIINIFIYVALGLVIALISYLFSLLTEAHTNKVRTLLIMK